MLLSPRKKKQSIKTLLVRGLGGLIVFFVLWGVCTWVRGFRGAVAPVSGDTVALELSSKHSLVKKVLELQSSLTAQDASLADLAALRTENELLKKELSRTDGQGKGVLARVITLPDVAIYDTIIIDTGVAEGAAVGQKVYAFGSVALGTVTDVREHQATVTLFSAPGRETAATASGTNTTVTLIGRGAGEYEVRMPRDIAFSEGETIVEQTIHSSVLATIQKVVSDPRDPFQRLLVKAPVNLQNVPWVVLR